MSLYRLQDPDLATEPPRTPRKWLRPVCWLLGFFWWPGHRWIITRESDASLAHLHPLAGCDAYCVQHPEGGRPWLTGTTR